MTAACGGNPVKPGALNPGAGNGGSGSTAFIVSEPRLAASAQEPCANQPIPEPGLDESEIVVAMCDVQIPEEPPAADETTADTVAPDAVVGEATTADVPAIRRFHR
jgi:hypothetical protein